MRMRTALLILASLALVAEAQINFGKSSASASFQGSVSSSANSRGSGSTSLTFGSSLSSQGRGFARVEGQQAASNSFSSNNGGRFGGESSLVASFSSSCSPLSKCSSVLFSSREFSTSSCKLIDGSAGTLCSHRTFQASSRRPFRWGHSLSRKLWCKKSFIANACPPILIGPMLESLAGYLATLTDD